MENRKFQARQGDIFFEATKKMPTSVKPYKSPILAYGEVTGHCHQITSDFAKVKSFVDTNGDIFVQSLTGNDITVEHDEHGPITIPGDTMVRISRQREYDPIAEEKERVVRD